MLRFLRGNCPVQYLPVKAEKFRAAGFEILEQGEAFCPVRFLDVWALLESRGVIESYTHRFFLIARKIS